MGDVRITLAVATVLRVFVDDATTPQYGYELMKLTGYASGKLYPILARLEVAGWLEAHFEDVDPAAEGRPVRKLYELTDAGSEGARRVLTDLSTQFNPVRA